MPTYELTSHKAQKKLRNKVWKHLNNNDDEAAAKLASNSKYNPNLRMLNAAGTNGACKISLMEFVIEQSRLMDSATYATGHSFVKTLVVLLNREDMAFVWRSSSNTENLRLGDAEAKKLLADERCDTHSHFN
jgi:hypothetical protein